VRLAQEARIQPHPDRKPRLSMGTVWRQGTAHHREVSALSTFEADVVDTSCDL